VCAGAHSETRALRRATNIRRTPKDTDDMNDLFVGWDVGAWNCDNNRRSRDALCVLAFQDSEPAVVRNPWRKNVRDGLVRHEGSALVDALLQLVQVDRHPTRHVTIAIAQ
jgi:hypothetical protein